MSPTLGQLTQSSSQAVALPQEALEKLLYRPDMAAWIFFRIEMDAFQSAFLKELWFTPEVEISAGFGSGKTRVVGWVFLNLSAVLLPDTVCMAIYQHFQAGKDNFWDNYDDPDLMTPLFRSQLGGFDFGGESQNTKASNRQPGNWKVFFKNRSIVSMPAPDHVRKARGLAGQDINRMLIDEHNKVAESEGGLSSVTLQLPGRVRRHSFNKDHPVWCNKLVRTSTAELGNHPAYPIHQNIERQVRRGNPSFGYMTGSYKDYSNLPSRTGRTFRQEYRDDKKIRAMSMNLSEEKKLAEMFGIWSGASVDWYSRDALDACQNLGMSRNLIPVLGRATDATGARALYFAGVDTARSAKIKSDDGAIVILRAVCRTEHDSDNEADYQVDAVHAVRFKDTDAEEWSGAIHALHEDFGFTFILIDQGGGGGDYISPQLGKERQVVRGVEKKCVPIVSRSEPAIHAHFILLTFLRTEDGMKKLWPDLAHARGDDVLKDRANTELKTAVDRAVIGLPMEHDDREKNCPETMKTWLPEQVAASKLLTYTKRQCLNYTALLAPDGQSWLMSSNGAKKFVCKGKDDFHDAFRNAYVAFRLWLLERDTGWQLRKGQRSLCGKPWKGVRAGGAVMGRWGG